METIIEGLAQYGPLGLWTASLLWMNWQQRKENKEDEQRAAEALKYHQEQIVQKLSEQRHMLEKTIEKIEGGLDMVKEKYAEERMFRMKEKQ
jgi:cell division protein FtsB